MEIITALLQETDKILILLARFSGLMMSPVFSARNIPVPWKAALVLLLTYFGWLLGLADNFSTPANWFNFVLVLVAELLIGILLSLVAQLFFAGIQLAGQHIDFQMGFGIVDIMDPMTGVPVPIIGNFYYIIAMLIYLQLDGHHLFLQAIYASYQTIPIGEFAINGVVIQTLLQFFGEVFVVGLKLSLPIAGTILVVDFVLGIISRTVPQMNIFMVGMPAKIIFGFGVLFMTLPLFIYLLNSMFERLFLQIDAIMRLVL